MTIVVLDVILVCVGGTTATVPLLTKPFNVTVDDCPKVSVVAETLIDEVLYENGYTETVVVRLLLQVSVP